MPLTTSCLALDSLGNLGHTPAHDRNILVVSDFIGSWECFTYEGGASKRCVGASIDLQREKIEQVETHLRTQQSVVSHLNAQLDRQKTAIAQ